MARRDSFHAKRHLPDKNYTVDKQNTLLAFLIEVFAEKSRSEVKSYLAHNQIYVNGKMTTMFDFPLKPGDNVTWKAVGVKNPNPNNRVRIVYEDDYILVVEKKYGVLTVSTGKENEQTAYSVMMDYVRRHNRNNRIFIVHRLDRDTSGLLLFAKSQQIQEILQTNWNENIITRRYIAVVEGVMEQESGQIVSWLTENRKSLKMNSSPIDNGGKKSITNYKTIKNNGKYSLLEINLETGRKNQIRVQLSSIGHPIAGDKKYGATSNPLGRICLHASTIAFKHPVTNEIMKFDTGIPNIFQ